MPVLTQGQTATLAMNTADSVTVEAGRSSFAIEYPVGTKIFEGSGFRTFGPFTGGSLKVTAVAGAIEYEFSDGSAAVAPILGSASDQAALQALVLDPIRKSVSAVAIMGDSIAQQNSNVVGGTYNTLSRGPVTWMLSYLGHPWDFQPTDNFAVFGTTLDVIVAQQLPAVLAANTTRKYCRVFMSCGTNDTSAARPIASIQADFMTLFSALRQAGIIPVHTGIRPRGTDVSLTVAKQANMQVNEWLYGLSLQGLIEYIPVGDVYADNSTAFGNALTALTYDSGTFNLHPNSRGAALEGRQMANYYTARGVAPGLVFAAQSADVFDRTNNPAGVAFNLANPLLTGGTTTPTGMLTTGGTWSLTSRTLSNGQTRAVRTCALAASALHHLYDDWIGSGAWGSNQLQPGDVIEGRALVRITGGVNINSVALRLTENDGVTSATHYAIFANETANLQGDHVLYLRTPRVPIRPYGGSGNVSIFARAECQTDAGGGGTFDVLSFEIRKVG